MRIELVEMGHRFQGTPRQILMQMKSLAFAAQGLSLGAYIDWNVENMRRGFNVDIQVTGETDDERAASFLEQMLGRGYARTV